MKVRYLLMVLMIALVSGCGTTAGQGSPGSGSDSGTTPPAAINLDAPANLDACKLLTLADATKVLGATAIAVGAERTSCTYNDAASGRIIGLALAGSIVFDANLKALKATNAQVENVSGLGDAAYYQVSGEDAILHVKKSGADVNITATVVGGHPETVDQKKAAEKQIAQLALPRM